MIIFTHGVIEVEHRRLPLVFSALFPVFFDSNNASSGDSENEQRVSIFDTTAILADEGYSISQSPAREPFRDCSRNKEFLLS